MTSQTSTQQWNKNPWREMGISILINALFMGLSLLFFAYAQPWLLARTVTVYQDRTPDILLGLVMLAAGILQVVGILIKWPYWESLPQFTTFAQKCGVAALTLLHFLVDAMWMIFLMLSFNLMDMVSAFQCIVGPIAMGLFFFCMAVVITAIYSFLGTSDGKLPGKLIIKASSGLSLAGDFFLLIGSLVMFCISWDVMQAISPPPEGGLEIAAYTIFYLWCYFSARVFSILPEWRSRPPLVQQLAFWAFLIAGWLGTFHLLPGG
jgi:hypothetical protein